MIFLVIFALTGLIIFLGIFVFSRKKMIIYKGLSEICFEITRKTWFYEKVLERHYVRDTKHYLTARKYFMKKHKIKDFPEIKD